MSSQLVRVTFDINQRKVQYVLKLPKGFMIHFLLVIIKHKICMKNVSTKKHHHGAKDNALSQGKAYRKQVFKTVMYIYSIYNSVHLI